MLLLFNCHALTSDGVFAFIFLVNFSWVHETIQTYTLQLHSFISFFQRLIVIQIGLIADRVATSPSQIGNEQSRVFMCLSKSSLVLADCFPDKWRVDDEEKRRSKMPCHKPLSTGLQSLNCDGLADKLGKTQFIDLVPA